MTPLCRAFGPGRRAPWSFCLRKGNERAVKMDNGKTLYPWCGK
ncbi:MAG: hypothetical protein RLZZ165_2196 [Bacteroidota bacterium]|jgi:hypothetical protein